MGGGRIANLEVSEARGDDSLAADGEVGNELFLQLVVLKEFLHFRL
jgi:hypothetical protein